MDNEQAKLKIMVGHIYYNYEEQLFDEIRDKFKLTTGDIMPEDAIKLEDIGNELTDILVRYINLNKKGGDK